MWVLPVPKIASISLMPFAALFMAIPLLEMAVRTLNEVSTFEEAGVSTKVTNEVGATSAAPAY